MPSPQHLSILDYTYQLPEEQIAKYPLSKRDESKLLVYKDGSITDSAYKHLHEHLPADSLLVFNNTKVVEARLLFTKSTGGAIELFCLEPGDQYADITTAMLQKGKVLWKCLVGGAKKWKSEPLAKQIDYGIKKLDLQASMVERLSDYFLIELSWDDASLSFAEVLHLAGQIPLPPYLNRLAEETDKTTYQTIYARHDGSVAAPTAGLHFTDSLFEQLAAKGIEHKFVTLHVGAGTFKPVKAATLQEHEMHAEFIDVTIGFIEDLLANLHKTIVPVGTTSLRTIESLYWLGVKELSRKSLVISHKSVASDQSLVVSGQLENKEEMALYQWDAYELPQDVAAADALQALIDWLKEKKLDRLITKTQLLVAPSYKLRIAKAIVTNFHQPQSTLLLLVAAIVGNDWRKFYDYALANNYRFLSYGDGCLLFAPES
ncbi:S-adenosylmethionine:tRNA ribosyltransferase-isomerase [Parasediminibacterium sp. JCM 36343]|uniref:S-adenosylmethionine:tRNA ribosyltransferase-isomerase n=1 Tax=Parasediminibacterium sp. JCM 36343 TaxID=3374279 RepID=UPI00397C197C